MEALQPLRTAEVSRSGRMQCMLLACTPRAALGGRPTPKLAHLEGHHDVGRELIHPRPDLLQVKQLRQGEGEGLQS